MITRTWWKLFAVLVAAGGVVFALLCILPARKSGQEPVTSDKSSIVEFKSLLDAPAVAEEELTKAPKPEESPAASLPVDSAIHQILTARTGRITAAEAFALFESIRNEAEEAQPLIQTLLQSETVNEQLLGFYLWLETRGYDESLGKRVIETTSPFVTGQIAEWLYLRNHLSVTQDRGGKVAFHLMALHQLQPDGVNVATLWASSTPDPLPSFPGL